MKYFKKPNGFILEYDPSRHDLDDLKNRFEECDEKGNPMPKKSKKKEK